MAIIYEENLKSFLKSGNIPPICILFGDDGYLKKLYVDKISKATATPDDIFNYARFNSDCDLQDVYDALSQLPMMVDRKCVILCDYDFEHCSKTDLDRLYELAGDGADSAVFVIWFDGMEIDPKKSSKFKKLVSAAEKCGGVAVELKHRGTTELVKMLTDGAKKRGSKMESSVAHYLIESVGDDINTLVNELDKLCLYMPNTEITKEQVDLVSAKTVEASVYNLSKQIFARRSGDALKTLDELFFNNIEPMIILYSIASPYTDMYRLYSFKKQGLKKSDMAKEFSYKRLFVLDNAERNLNNFDYKRLDLSFKALIEADKQLKTNGVDQRIILEQLIVKLIYIIAKGESIDNA